MIYTVTFNPSLDYIVTVPEFRMGMTNRTGTEMMLPGGKGINVSTVLKNLGIENTALGFVAGFTGEEIRRRVEEIGIRTEFIGIEEGFSRINLKIKNIEGTEINGNGPVIRGDKVGRLMEYLKRLGTEDYLVLAGSIPPSLPDSIYRDIIREMESRGVQVVVDATKDLLTNVLAYHPFLIKPNNHELGRSLIRSLRHARRSYRTPRSCARRERRMCWYPWQARELFWQPRTEEFTQLRLRKESWSTAWEPGTPWWRDFSPAGWNKKITAMRFIWESLPEAPARFLIIWRRKRK